MTTKNDETNFDCIEFKHQQQLRIYETIKDMTPDEQIQYFRTQAENGPLGEWWKKLKNKSSKKDQQA